MYPEETWLSSVKVYDIGESSHILWIINA